MPQRRNTQKDTHRNSNRGAGTQNDDARDLANRVLGSDGFDLLRSSPTAELSHLFRTVSDEALALILARLDDQEAADILLRMPPPEAADVLERIDPDDATDIFQWIDQASEDVASALMGEIDTHRANLIQHLLAYAPDTAGCIMTPAFVSIDPELRANDAIAAIQRLSAQVETMSYIYVTDSEGVLLGVLSLHSLVLNPPETPVRELMAEHTWSIPEDEDQEVAAQLLMERDLAALPVVDYHGRLLGIITHDDVADIIEAEATEDIARLGGSQPLETPYRRAGIWHLVR